MPVTKEVVPVKSATSRFPLEGNARVTGEVWPGHAIISCCIWTMRMPFCGGGVPAPI
jgi:hypothetical protein